MQLTPVHPNQTCFPFFPEIEVRIRKQRWTEKYNRPKKVILKRKLDSSLPLTTNDSFSLFFDQAKEIAKAIGDDLDDVLEVVEWTDRDVYQLHGHLLKISLKCLEFRSDLSDEDDDTSEPCVDDQDDEEADDDYSLTKTKKLKRRFKSRAKTFLEISKSEWDDVRDVLHWIYNPGIPDRVTRAFNGVEEVVDIPFTFGTCCRLLQFDPDIAKYRYQHIWDEFIRQQNQHLYQRYSPQIAGE